jgi:hypothetical protein
MCFVWISEQTAIVSIYSINWLVFTTKAQSLLRGTGSLFTAVHFRFMRVLQARPQAGYYTADDEICTSVKLVSYLRILNLEFDFNSVDILSRPARLGCKRMHPKRTL